MGVVQNAVNWAVAIANDASHGYDQTNRWGPITTARRLLYPRLNMPVCR